MTKNYDLDVAMPENVSGVLRATANKYRESQSELESAWQDPHAGRIWGEIARILERAADSADKAVDRMGGIKRSCL